MSIPECLDQSEHAASILLLGKGAAYHRVRRGLEAAGMNVAFSGQPSRIAARLTDGCFDLVVISTPRAPDGLKLCEDLRCQAPIPVILLFHEPARAIRIAALDAGADDCLSQPVLIQELLARIRSVLRRSGRNAAQSSSPMIAFDGWRINPSLRIVANPDGMALPLTAAEFDILLAFCLNPGRALSRSELIAAAHLGVAGPGERCIDVHIRHLRCKIEQDPGQPSLIKTIRLAGYVFTGTVRRDPAGIHCGKN